jgi:hypothetical protein
MSTLPKRKRACDVYGSCQRLTDSRCTALPVKPFRSAFEARMPWPSRVSRGHGHGSVITIYGCSAILTEVLACCRSFNHEGRPGLHVLDQWEIPEPRSDCKMQTRPLSSLLGRQGIGKFNLALLPTFALEKPYGCNTCRNECNIRTFEGSFTRSM